MHRISFVLALMAFVALSDSQAGLRAATPGLASQQVTPVVSPLVGGWASDTMPPIRSMTNSHGIAPLEFWVDDDTVSILSLSGRMETMLTLRASALMFETDGREHPTPSGGAYVATWVGSHVLRVELRSDGTVRGLRTYDVSADGQRLTVTTVDRDAVGADTESVIVLERRH